MAERDALQEEALKHGDEELMKEYKKLRNKVRHQLKKDQPTYYKDKFQDESMSIRKAWKLAYDLLGKVSNKSPTKIKHENRIVTNPKALASAFSQIFRDKVRNLCEQTNVEPKIDPVERLDEWLSERSEPIPTFKLKTINKDKLRKLMKKLKPSRSHGVDFIDSYSLKLTSPLIEDSILHLVNLSISSNTYSRNWKFQLVLPLHKKNDTMDGNNFRPVSHIIEVGKVVEYVIHDKLYNHFV